MGKAFVQWMAAGIGGILAAAVQVLTSGGGINLKAAGVALLTAVVLRAANWVVSYFGPKPAAPPVEASSRAYR